MAWIRKYGKKAASIIAIIIRKLSIINLSPHFNLL